MKLKEYMALCEPGTEITCWDKDVDSEFYFYTKEAGEKSLFDKEFPNLDKCMEMLPERLDVVKIHDGGIEVNLYELLENPKIIEFAKKNMFETHQYEDDSDVVMMLFDDNVNNISQGFEGFSELMVRCLSEAYGNEKSLTPGSIGDDFIAVKKNELASFVQSYIDELEDQDVMHTEIVHVLLLYFSREDLEKMGFAEFIEDCLDCVEQEKPALEDVIHSCEEVNKNNHGSSVLGEKNRDDDRKTER